MRDAHGADGQASRRARIGCADPATPVGLPREDALHARKSLVRSRGAHGALRLRFDRGRMWRWWERHDDGVYIPCDECAAGGQLGRQILQQRGPTARRCRRNRSGGRVQCRRQLGQTGNQQRQRERKAGALTGGEVLQHLGRAAPPGPGSGCAQEALRRARKRRVAQGLDTCVRECASAPTCPRRNETRARPPNASARMTTSQARTPRHRHRHTPSHSCTCQVRGPPNG